MEMTKVWKANPVTYLRKFDVTVKDIFAGFSDANKIQIVNNGNAGVTLE